MNFQNAKMNCVNYARRGWIEMYSESLIAKIKNVKRYARMYQIPKTTPVTIAWNILKLLRVRSRISILNTL